jgi:hypothetical protein
LLRSIAFHVLLLGSAEQHVCYFYKRTNKPPVMTASRLSATKMLTLEPRPGNLDDPVVPKAVCCDPAFYETCRLAANIDHNELKYFAKRQVEKFLDSPRSLRSATTSVV